MVGASSSADLSGVPGNRKAKNTYGSDRASGYAGDSVPAAYHGGEDERTALKGVQTGSDPEEGSHGQGASGWDLFRSRFGGADAVRISDAGRSAPGPAAAQAAAQDAAKSASTGSKLSIKA
jgi:hypothetical protein